MQYFRTDSPFNVFLMTFLARNVLFPWIILSQWMCMIFINLYYLNGKCSSRVSCFCVIKPLLYVTFNDIILLETRTFSWTLDYVAFQHKIACYTHTHTHARTRTHTHAHTYSVVEGWRMLANPEVSPWVPLTKSQRVFRLDFGLLQKN